MTKEHKILLNYLKALKEVREIPEGSRGYSCFGNYNSCNPVCKERSVSTKYIICQVCCTEHGYIGTDWMASLISLIRLSEMEAT